MKTLYEATVTSEGGRSEGRVKSSDGILDLKITAPKELGGNGSETNPEQLFAAGYAACFESALQLVAKNKKLNLTSTKVVAHVGIGSDTKGRYQLSVKLEIYIKGVSKEEGSMLVSQAHLVCPYSNAIRNNIDVRLEFIP